MWPNPLETANLVKFTEEILNGKLIFLCSVGGKIQISLHPNVKNGSWQRVDTL